MASSSKPTAVHFSLIFFVMLSIILGVMAYMMYRSHDELQASLTQSTTDLNAAQNAMRRKDTEIQELARVLGREFDTVGIDGASEDPTTVLGSTRSDIRTYGGDDLPQQTVNAALLRLRQQLDTVLQERNSLQADLNDHKQQILALQGQYQSQVDQHDNARRQAETDLQGLIQNKEEELATKDREIANLRSNLSQVQLELEQEREGRARDNDQKNREIAQLTTINDRLRETLDEVTRISFERSDGVIRRVDHVSSVVWINLGEADNLPLRTNFSVYEKDNQRVGGNPEDIKGSIEVIRILGPHLAEARVVEDDIFRPITPGDAIYTPLWSPGKKESFSFVGLIDIDGDGHSDRKLIREMIEATGARIDNEVDDDGNRTGDGISVTTKFLVVGEIPDPSTTSKPSEQEWMERIIKHHSDMQKEARMQGVRIISLNDFLSYIGYKPYRRLWRPGEDVPWLLQAGARSTAVNESPGNKASSGNVSGVYTRSKRLKAPTSTGNTSPIFRGGYGN